VLSYAAKNAAGRDASYDREKVAPETRRSWGSQETDVLMPIQAAQRPTFHDGSPVTAKGCQVVV